VLETSTSFGPARALTPAYFDAERLHRVANGHGAADRSLRAVEHCEEAVARGVHLAASKAIELYADDGVMRVKQRAPVTVADLGGPARRVDNVGEQHGGENPIIGHVCMLAGEELSDRFKGLSPWFDEVIYVPPWELDVFRAGYVISDVSAHRGQDQWVVGVLDHERRHANCRKNRTHVHFGH
jgi:hypothetical protein